MSNEPVTEELMDRVMRAERLLTDEKFRSRDEAVRLLVASSKDDQAKYLAIAGCVIGVAGVLLNFIRH